MGNGTCPGAYLAGRPVAKTFKNRLALELASRWERKAPSGNSICPTLNCALANLLAATFDKAKPVAIRSVWPISPGKGFDAPCRLVYIH